MNKKDDIYVMEEVMNETEDICETKTIINFIKKIVKSPGKIRASPPTARCASSSFRLNKMATLVELLDNL